MQIRDAIEHYLAWLTDVRSPSPHTVRAYAGDLKQWLQHVGGDHLIRDVRPDCVYTFVRGQRAAGLSRSTIGRRLAAIRGLQRWLIAHQLAEVGLWDFSGLQSVRTRPLPRVANSGDIEELHRHLRACLLRSGDILLDVRSRPHQATTLLAASLMIATGMRVAETCSLALAHIDVKVGSIRVVGKGLRDRTVYVTSPWLIRLLEAHLAVRRERGIVIDLLLFNRVGQPLTPASVRHRFAVASRDAQLTRCVTPHMLRHAAATCLLEAGVDIRIVQRLLGHASITTTEIYTHVNDVTLRHAIAQADVLGTVMNQG